MSRSGPGPWMGGSADLETIVLKAIEKDPRARYQTAEAMGEDLGRFLADEPIRARQVGRRAFLAMGPAIRGSRCWAGCSRRCWSRRRSSRWRRRPGTRGLHVAEKFANDRSQRDRKDAIEALKAAEIQAKTRSTAQGRTAESLLCADAPGPRGLA